MSFLERLSRPPAPEQTNRRVFPQAVIEAARIIKRGQELLVRFDPQTQAQIKLYFLNHNWPGLESTVGTSDPNDLVTVAATLDYLAWTHGQKTAYSEWIKSKQSSKTKPGV